MNFINLVQQYLKHNRARTIWTIIAVSLAIFCFLLLQTVSWGWKTTVEQRRDDRIAIWNKTTYALTLPREYAQRLVNIEGVFKTTFASYFEGIDVKSAQKSKDFDILAVDVDSYFDVYPESTIDPQHLKAWKETPRGVIVSEKIARYFDYKIGDIVNIEGQNFPGVWEFEIVGTYYSNVRTFADNLFLFRWDYLNDNLSPTDLRRDEISWMMSLVDYRRSIEVGQAVDQYFSTSKIQTQSMTERSMIGMFMANFAGILDVINTIGMILLLTIALILGNSMAMKIRQRKFDFGVLRAIGFTKAQIVGFILGEAAIIGLLGGVVGVALSYWIINHNIGTIIEKNMGSLFPFFNIPPSSIILGIFLPALLAIAAAIIPAIKSSQLDIVSMLRDIE